MAGHSTSLVLGRRRVADVPYGRGTGAADDVSVTLAAGPSGRQLATLKERRCSATFAAGPPARRRATYRARRYFVMQVGEPWAGAAARKLLRVTIHPTEEARIARMTESHQLGWGGDHVGKLVKLRNAVRILAEGFKKPADRLEQATLCLSTLQPQDFPEPLRKLAARVLSLRRNAVVEHAGSYPYLPLRRHDAR